VADNLNDLDKKLIETEIQKRVQFRLTEIEVQIKVGLSAAKLADRATFGHLHTRGFLQAYQMMNDVLEKELSMGTPYDGDFEHRIWQHKEELVNKLSDRLLNIGTRDYMHKKSLINNYIEEFTNI